VNELALFAGAGGGILGGHLLGWRCVCAVEFNAYARSVLLARQNDGTLPPFPIWDDVRTFDGRPWRGLVDVVSGGFPCQDISAAGKGDGLDGERSGLWSEMARIIGEVRPRFAFVENSPMLTGRGLGRVLGDLAALGFDAEWGVLGAADVGAPHVRERIWIVAHAMRDGLRRPGSTNEVPFVGGRAPQRGEVASQAQSSRKDVADSLREGLSLSGQEPNGANGEQSGGGLAASGRWPAEPGLDRMAHGVAHRTDRIRAIGNGQVPRVAATAWRILTEAL
jgi:DNA (cytosine-5)-methyltransferase 1